MRAFPRAVLTFYGLIAINAAMAQSEETLLIEFWNASPETVEERGDALREAAGDVRLLYDLLKRGPEFSGEVATGVVHGQRVDSNGTVFPYAFLIPESYDPARAYPVEFMLHGGVGREKPSAGDEYWRGGFDSIRTEDSIVVVPVAWRDAYWWHPDQAQNLVAILRELKRLYNVDDNRVTLSGVSDGGTGAYFYAFKQPSQWATFLAYIGHPGVLRNAQSGGGYRLYFENLVNKSLYIVNGENDRLYPAASLASFIQILEDERVEHVFRVIDGGGHNTRWMPSEWGAIEQFKREHPRIPYPSQVQWVADRTDRFNRNHWVRIDRLSEENRPSLIVAQRDDNKFYITTRGVAEFTLLLNPEEVDFDKPVQVLANGEVILDEKLVQDPAVLLHWATRELDRQQLFTAELELTVSEQADN